MVRVFVLAATGNVFGGVQAATTGEQLQWIRAVSGDQLHRRGSCGHWVVGTSVSIVVVSGQSEHVTT